MPRPGSKQQLPVDRLQMIDQEHGTFEISADTVEALEAAVDILRNMVQEPEEGATYRQVKVASVEKFGLFVEFLPEQQVSAFSPQWSQLERLFRFLYKRHLPWPCMFSAQEHCLSVQ